MELILFVIFFFLIIRFAVMLFNFISNPQLRRVVRYYQDKVSILIPVRNEEDHIIFLLNSILEQDYTQYEVLILDDGSVDNTFQLCEAFAAEHPKFRVIKGDPLPDGWLGKNYACHQLAQQAKGKYLLFLGARGQIHKGLLNTAVHRMVSKNLALLSLFTNQEMLTLGERMTVPLMHHLLLSLLPLKLVYLLKSPAFAVASGQFMLFDTVTYIQYNWHNNAKGQIAADTDIMRNIKSVNLKGEVLLTNGLISYRMYDNYTEATNGFSRKFLAAFNNNIPVLIIYLTLVIGGPIVVVATLNYQLMLFMFGIIMLGRSMVSLAAGQNRNLNMFLHPFQMINMAYIGFLSIKGYLTKSYAWKNRKL